VGAKQIRYGLSTRRRDFRRAAVVSALALLALAAAGCGGGGHDSTAESEKAADTEVVNGALERELTAIDAYGRGLDRLHGRDLALVRELSAQDQENVDALTKALRGLDGKAEAEAAELEGPAPGPDAALTLAYEQENAALAYYMDAARRLQTIAPRVLAVSIGAGHAQHLVVLRQALGVPLAASFEPGGDLPPPHRPGEEG
jgi:Ferritin-like domain